MVLISFTKQFFTFHFNRVKREKQILPSVGFEPTTSCIHGKRLTVGSNPTEGKICFSRFTLLEWNRNVKNCFVKLCFILYTLGKLRFCRSNILVLYEYTH